MPSKTIMLVRLSAKGFPKKVFCINATQYVRGIAFDMFCIASGNAPNGIVAPDKKIMGINIAKPIVEICFTLLQTQDNKKPRENIAVIDIIKDNANAKKLPCIFSPKNSPVKNIKTIPIKNKIR